MKIRTAISLVQKSWFYFRIGNGAYVGFFLGFSQWIVIMYSDFLSHLPFLAGLHFWLFAILFTPSIWLVGAMIGYIHQHTQAFMDARISAPASPYVYKMFPLGKEAKLGVPSSLTQYEYQLATLEWQDEVSRMLKMDLPSFEKRFGPKFRDYRDKTQTLLDGGEVR